MSTYGKDWLEFQRAFEIEKRERVNFKVRMMPFRVCHRTAVCQLASRRSGVEASNCKLAGLNACPNAHRDPETTDRMLDNGQVSATKLFKLNILQLFFCFSANT